MRKTIFVAAAIVAATLVPAPASAWGFTAHKLIMARAIELLPPELKPLFERYREEALVRVTDPDIWRNAGWEDDPNHFVDFGMKELGEYPFRELPREYGAALEKFGASLLNRVGRLPWREAEEFGNPAFRRFKRGQHGPGTPSCFRQSRRTTFRRAPAVSCEQQLRRRAHRQQRDPHAFSSAI